MQMDDNLGTQELNVLPKKLSANVLKIWQRLAVAGAALEIFERKKEKAPDVQANMLEAYKRHVVIILNKYSNELPRGLTEPIFLSNTVDWKKGNRPLTILTGKQLWESIWQPLAKYIQNVILPIWMEIRPVTKNGVVRSGVENWEPVLLELRKRLFNWDKNSLALMNDNTGAKEHSDAEDDEESDQVVQSKRSKTSAKKSPRNATKETAASTSNNLTQEAVGATGTSTSALNNGSGETDTEGVIQKESESSDVKSKRGRKSHEPGKMIPFDHDWFPLAWLAFREYGPLSERPNPTWITLVTTKEKPIDVDDDGNLVDIPVMDKKETNDQSLGRRTQRKKERSEVRGHPKNFKAISIDDDEEDDEGSQKNLILTEFSTIRRNLVKSDGIQEYDAMTRRSQLQMELIEKMNLSVEQKQLEYQKIWDSLQTKPQSS